MMRKPIATEILLYDWAKLHNGKTPKTRILRFLMKAQIPVMRSDFKKIMNFPTWANLGQNGTFSLFFSEKSQNTFFDFFFVFFRTFDKLHSNIKKIKNPNFILLGFWKDRENLDIKIIYFNF